MAIYLRDIPRHLQADYLLRELFLVRKTIEKVRYLRLKRELSEGVNPEINTDKQTLISRMEELGFRKAIVEALQELDRKLYAAGKPLDFKEAMDLTRTVLEEVVEDAAREVAAVTNQVLPPPGGSDFQPWKQLLMNAGVLTADEGELFQKLYNYLSNAGAHRLGSAPEQARISRNMVIESGLLLVERVRVLKQGSKQGSSPAPKASS
ncbi:MAG: hypothetical protein L0191_12135 [Acidobacteria bacterium]|nr:hypothetical protein [Acidobacteriota bacterium]